MTYTTSSFGGPDTTPRSVKNLIIATGLAVLLSALTEPLFTAVLELPGMQEWLSLSWWGMQTYLYWQPITYLFVQSMEGIGISLYFVLTLVFNLYLLWIMGSGVQQMVGTGPFLRLYFCSGIAAAFGALFMMPLSGNYPVLTGALPAILALMTVWTMINPSLELLLFFLFPIKAKWLLLGIVACLLLINISSGALVPLAFYLTPIVFGYCYAVLAWGFQGPFSWSHGFDRLLGGLGSSLRRGGQKVMRMGEKAGNKTKIYDINTGKPMESDEMFIDAMLAKISRKGEGSLTYRERKRMQEISERKNRDKRNG